MRIIIMTIYTEFQEFLNSHRLPIIELELLDGDYLIIDINVDNDKITFTFDQQCDTYFDGAIEGENGYYYYIYDNEFDTLQSLFELVYANITEGYTGIHGLT